MNIKEMGKHGLYFRYKALTNSGKDVTKRVRSYTLKGGPCVLAPNRSAPKHQTYWLPCGCGNEQWTETEPNSNTFECNKCGETILVNFIKED